MAEVVILQAMPSPDDFYGRYWNRQAFVVRDAIAAGDIEKLISADQLAGLALEEAPRSRIVKPPEEGRDWSCEIGPFVEEDFTAAAEKDWSLLVQNVEQYHPETATLLRHFSFTPRWLMDDIMVSYSVPGGSVGPHIDSYHVFLVQGMGRRRWKIGRQAMARETYISGLDLEILADDFVGDDIEVGCGDMLYLPPKFAHQGTTLESSLTFSVGFLGPRLSELFSSYGQYLSTLEDVDGRYLGDGLDPDSAGFIISAAAANKVRDDFSGHLGGPHFNRWLVEFFSRASHQDFAVDSERQNPVSRQQFETALQDGAGLIKPPYVKFAITEVAGGGYCLGYDGHYFMFSERFLPLLEKLAGEQPLNGASEADPASLEILFALYCHEALEFSPPWPHNNR